MLRLTQQDLAEKAGIARHVLQLLEDARRARPSIEALLRLQRTLEAEGLELLEATEEQGEGIRWRLPTGKRWIDQLRPARLMLGMTLDDLEAISGVNRYTIVRIENDSLTRMPEQAAMKLREALAANGAIVLPEDPGAGAGVRMTLVTRVRYTYRHFGGA
ncbi:hypothetical protein CO660_05500 [Rhizobium sp. L9]|uniref:hypothetical protein n=1 Tax=Rhizobium sp. L9 TaxID=1340738 RepID=UPI000BE96043|nr:hypothetical protein [Rhizobium sp. L9]PDT30795.1 hypothetical protein CO660_05500 [Rhizobium sp. L9]